MRPACLQRLYPVTACRLAGADGGDLGAHRRTVGEIETQHADARIVAARLQISIQIAPCQIAVSVMQQIHHGERDLVQHVYPSQRGRELDTVERHGHAIDERDVAQVQVAMTFAHETMLAAQCEQRRTTFPLAQRRQLQHGELLQIGHVRQQHAHLFEVLHRGRADGRGVPECRLRIDCRGALMENRNGACQRIDVRRLHSALLQTRIHQRVIGEAAHLHRVFDGGLHTELRRINAAAYCHHFEIEIGCGAPVQTQLFFAKIFSGRKREVIEKSKIDSFLDLVREVADQQHPGDMRLDHLRAMRTLQCRDQTLLIGKGSHTLRLTKIQIPSFRRRPESSAFIKHHVSALHCPYILTGHRPSPV